MRPDPKTIAARLRALAQPHLFPFHGWLAVHPSIDEAVRIDERALQSALVALADELDHEYAGYVMPLDEPRITRVDFFVAPLLPRSEASPLPAL